MSPPNQPPARRSEGAAACPSCGFALAADAVRCGNCKAVLGEANRCPSCQAQAAVREVAEGRFACAACGKPRTPGPGTVVESDYASALVRDARTSGLLGTLARLFAVGLGLLGVSAGGFQAAFDLGSPTVTMAVFVAGAVGLFFTGGRMHARKSALLERALERRLMSEVTGSRAGVTVQAAARAVSAAENRVDGMLTQLAKRGSVELDVDDEGIVRYRVATDSLSLDGDDDMAAASRDAASLPRRGTP